MERHINRWLNETPLLFSELTIGSIIEAVSIIEVVKLGDYSKNMTAMISHIITGIHLSGALEIQKYSDYKLNEANSETIVTSLKDIKPLKLPEDSLGNIDYYLKDTGFIKTDQQSYEYDFSRSAIKLFHRFSDNYWTIEYKNIAEGFNILLPIYFFHEFQNVFQYITRKNAMKTKLTL